MAENSNKEKITARITSKEKMPERGRFVPDSYSDHAYHGQLYSYECTTFGITICPPVPGTYGEIKNLIVGIGLLVSYHTDIPIDDLVVQYRKCAGELNELTHMIKTGDIVEICVSSDIFQKNRSLLSAEEVEYVKKFSYDPCLWKKDGLLFAPFGYEQIDYGDGRWTLDPEVLDLKIVKNV